MTSITIAHAPESKIATVAKAVLNFLSSLWETIGTTPQPLLMIQDALGVSREEVERRLSNSAWRNIGRYL